MLGSQQQQQLRQQQIVEKQQQNRRRSSRGGAIARHVGGAPNKVLEEAYASAWAVAAGFGRVISSCLLNMSGSIEGATIKLNGMTLDHEFTQPDQLFAVIGHQYLMMLLRQLYKVLGSLELVGNPVHLMNNISTGVRDFFYEPVLGMIKGGQAMQDANHHSFMSKRYGQTQGFTRGVAKGTISLVGNTTYGVFNAASRITTNLGHGVAVLSMDADYLRHRQGAHAGVVGAGATGMAGGGKIRKKQVVGDTVKRLGGDMDGIVSGLTGLVSKPLEGARDGGVRGFARGLGAGVAGAISKPTAGMLDMVTHMSEGVRDLAAGLVLHKQQAAVTRFRPPHTFAPSPDGRLLSFTWSRSQGLALMEHFVMLSPNDLVNNISNTSGNKEDGAIAAANSTAVTAGGGGRMLTRSRSGSASSRSQLGSGSQSSASHEEVLVETFVLQSQQLPDHHSDPTEQKHPSRFALHERSLLVFTSHRILLVQFRATQPPLLLCALLLEAVNTSHVHSTKPNMLKSNTSKALKSSGAQHMLVIGMGTSSNLPSNHPKFGTSMSAHRSAAAPSNHNESPPAPNSLRRFLSHRSTSDTPLLEVKADAARQKLQLLRIRVTGGVPKDMQPLGGTDGGGLISGDFAATQSQLHDQTRMQMNKQRGGRLGKKQGSGKNTSTSTSVSGDSQGKGMPKGKLASSEQHMLYVADWDLHILRRAHGALHLLLQWKAQEAKEKREAEELQKLKAKGSGGVKHQGRRRSLTSGSESRMKAVAWPGDLGAGGDPANAQAATNSNNKRRSTRKSNSSKRHSRKTASRLSKTSIFGGTGGTRGRALSDSDGAPVAHLTQSLPAREREDAASLLTGAVGSSDAAAGVEGAAVGVAAAGATFSPMHIESGEAEGGLPDADGKSVKQKQCMPCKTCVVM